MVTAQKLDTFVEIQEYRQLTVDGATRGAWVTFGTDVVDIVGLRAEERVRADHVEGLRTHKVWMRYRSDIRAKHRLKRGTTVYNIDAVEDGPERRRETILRVVQSEAEEA